MPNRYDRDFDERNRGDFSGYYARDPHRGGFSDDYARDGGWSGGGRADDYAREPWGGSGAAGDWLGSGYRGGYGDASVGYGPGQTRSTYGRGESGGLARAYAPSYRGRGPKNWRRSDEAIREMVNERLTDADEVDATDVEVQVESAEVTLSGVVGSRREKRIAEDVAWSCGGVHDVHNRLTIGDREQHIGKASE